MLYLGKIYKNNVFNCTLENAVFFDEDVKFINPILKKTINIEQSKGNSIQVRFFKGSSFEQILVFHYFSNEFLFSEKGKLSDFYDKNIKNIDNNLLYEDPLSKVLIYIPDKNYSIDEKKEILFTKNASWFVRNNNTLSFNEFKEFPESSICIEERGFSYLFKYTGTKSKQCFRVVLLNMLALAYYCAFQEINNKLSEILKSKCNENVDELDKLYSEVAIFNAAYYFHHPVEFSKHSTFKAWENMRESYHLVDKYKEVLDQLTQVHQILNYVNEKAENKLLEKRNWKLSVVGTVISLSGIIEVIHTLLNW